LSASEAAGFEPLATRDTEPAFEEPWQAEVLGVAFTLAERGAFSRAEWSDALGAALARAAGAGAPDTQATYYAAALEALESLLASSGAVSSATLAERTEAWRRAYLATPHGQPVALSAGDEG
jgi:nitrile hydratase accessory protein